MVWQEASFQHLIQESQEMNEENTIKEIAQIAVEWGNTSPPPLFFWSEGQSHQMGNNHSDLKAIGLVLSPPLPPLQTNA